MFFHLPKKVRDVEMRLKGTQQRELHGELQGDSARTRGCWSSISNRTHTTKYHLPVYNGKLKEHFFFLLSLLVKILACCKHL